MITPEQDKEFKGFLLFSRIIATIFVAIATYWYIVINDLVWPIVIIYAVGIVMHIICSIAEYLWNRKKEKQEL